MTVQEGSAYKPQLYFAYFVREFNLRTSNGQGRRKLHMKEITTHTYTRAHTHTNTYIFTLSNVIDEKLIIYISVIFFIVFSKTDP